MVRDAAEVSAVERIAELEHTIRSLREDSEVAHALLGLSGALAEVRSMEETLHLAVRLVPELLGADRCFSATWIATQERFEITAHHGFEPRMLDRLYTVAAEPDGLSLQREALRTRAPFLIGDTAAEGAFSPEEAELRGTRAYIGLPLVRWGEDFGCLGVGYAAPRRFTAKDEALARGIARTVGVALANARQLRLLQTLRLFGERIGAKLSLRRVVDEVADGARRLLNGDASWIYFVDPPSNSLVVTGAEPLPVEGLGRLDITADIWRPLTQGKAIPITNVEEIIDDPAGPMSAVIAPISGSDSPLLGAVLVLFNRTLPLATEDVEALSVLAAQSAMAIDNAQRFERQHRVARSLQEGLLTTEMPELEDFAVGTVYESAGEASEIGGDFFDVFDLPDGRIGFAVGDVSGKGAEAAAQTAMAKYMLRAFATRNPAPSSALYHLNNALMKSFGEDRFLSVVYAVLDPATKRMVIGRGGHPAPLVYRYQTHGVEAIEAGGILLGCFEDENFEQVPVDLDDGDVFLAYTDGLVEARDETRLYGRWRLEKALGHFASSFSVERLARRLYEDAKEFGTIVDDTVVLTLGRRMAPK